MTAQAKRALVTGASSGIGAEISQQLQARGYHVTGLSRRSIETSDSFEAWALDLSDIVKLEAALSSDTREFDVLILAAGFGRFASLEEFSYQQINQLINTNLIANLYLCKRFIPAMKRQKFGDVVFIASEAALAGARFGAVYSASKFALRGLAQSLRAETRNANIRVMSCFPGPVSTPFFDELNFEPQMGREFVLDASDVASALIHSLEQPRHVVAEEIVIQALKRSFVKTQSD